MKGEDFAMFARTHVCADMETSVFVFADVSVRSPRKLFTFIIIENVCLWHESIQIIFDFENDYPWLKRLNASARWLKKADMHVHVNVLLCTNKYLE